MLRTILAAAVALACLAGHAAAERLSVGYFASFVDDQVDKIPWKNLTHVCHAYLKTDDTGALVTDERMPSPALTTAAHARGVRVLVSLGGGRTTTGLERVTQSRAPLAKYADSVVELVAANGYDGVDIVWEFPRDKATRRGFVALVAYLRAGLDKRAAADGRTEPYLLTAAAPPSAFFGKWIDTGAVLGRLDWLHVITYDMVGPWSRAAGHHAPLLPSPADPERSWRSVSQAMDYWHADRAVPKQKLVIGVPMFGRALPVAAPHAPLDPADRKLHGTLTFAEIRELAGKGWPAKWDPQSKAPWLQAPKDKPLVIAYDDRNSVDQKAKWGKAQGYRGLFFWAIHQDRMDDGTHWLIRAAERAWPVGKLPPSVE
ncbi:MAG: glycoside hydrolase family 18 protein [Planctomycetota bacterium]